MTAPANPDLRFRKMWLVIGYMMIAIVVYLSLTSDPLQVDMGLPYEDKLFHMLAYFSMMFWFMLIYHARRQQYGWAIFFISMGLLMEYIQGFNSARYSEFGDMIANTVGVMLALGLSVTQARFALVKLERYLR